MVNPYKQPSANIDSAKEFLKIKDMLEKLGVTRTQFWRMRKAGEVPPPVINNPQMWLASKVTEFYENRASEQQSL